MIGDQVVENWREAFDLLLAILDDEERRFGVGDILARHVDMNAAGVGTFDAGEDFAVLGLHGEFVERAFGHIVFGGELGGGSVVGADDEFAVRFGGEARESSADTAMGMMSVEMNTEASAEVNRMRLLRGGFRLADRGRFY